MTPAGGAVLGAGAVTAAFVVWATGTLVLQGQLGEWQPRVLGDGVTGLWAGQLLAMALWLPVCVDHDGALEGVGAGVLLAVFPVPVLTIACLMGGLAVGPAVAGVATVVVVALVLVGLAGLARRFVQSGPWRLRTIGSLQSVAVVLVLLALAVRLAGPAP